MTMNATVVEDEAEGVLPLGGGRRSTAEAMATKQRDISVSEFFTKNRHLLGFDNPAKALLTTIKEAVDNALDACEEAGILPTLEVAVEEVAEGRYRVRVEDNGPGIVKEQIPKIFAKLLYGSKFHRLRQSLTADQAVVVERNGRVERVPIGTLVDALLSRDEEVRDVSGLGIRVPAFDPERWGYAWREVSHVIRHRRENEVLEVRTEQGKRVRVTGCHSLFTFDKTTWRVREVEARALVPGDFVVAPRSLPAPGEERDVNVLGWLEASAIEARWIYVYGVSPAVFGSVRARAEVVHKRSARGRSRRYLRLPDVRGGTVDILDESWKQYETKGFFPAGLVYRLGLERHCGGAVLRTYHHGRVLEAPVTWRLSPALVRFLGLFVAEGHGDTRQVGFTFSVREQHLVDEVCATAATLGCTTRVEAHPNNAVRVKVFGGALDLLLPVWCGRGARNKRVPPFIYKASRDLRQHFLDALHQGDGHRVPGREALMLTTTSRNLMADVELLWLLQGVVASRSGPFTHKGLGRDPSTVWHLTVHGADIAASKVYRRREVRDRLNRYRMFPRDALDLAVGDEGRVRPTEASILQAVGLGLGPAGADRSVALIGAMTPGRSYTVPEMTGIVGSRVTRHLPNHFASLGYLRPVGDSYEATAKVETLQGQVRAVQSFAASDLCLLRVESVEVVEGENPFVYDLSVPGCENFVAGEGPLACHNSRGQQGIGISAAGMYGQLTTGRPVVVVSKTGKGRPAWRIEVRINARTNEPEVLNKNRDQTVTWEKDHGTAVEIELAGTYRGGRTSVDAYLEQTVVANPHLELRYKPPKGAAVFFPRVSEHLPPEAQEIKPHPHGVELGMLLKILQESRGKTARQALTEEFSRVTPSVADELCKRAGISPDAAAAKVDGAKVEVMHGVMVASAAVLPTSKRFATRLARSDGTVREELLEEGSGFTPASAEGVLRLAGVEPGLKAKLVTPSQVDRIYDSLHQTQVRILPPPATCVVPVGEELILQGLKRRFDAEFYASHTRPPAVYRGNPFVVEAGIAFGGSLGREDAAETMRFANRVPLLYQPRACAITEAVLKVDWKSYGLQQRKGELPVGPLAIFVHLASVWVPFTSEAKEAVAHYDDIVREIRMALMECGRKLGTFVRAKESERWEEERRNLFAKYILELSVSIHAITGIAQEKVRDDFQGALPRHVKLAPPAPTEPTEAAEPTAMDAPPDDPVVPVSEAPVQARASEPPPEAEEDYGSAFEDVTPEKFRLTAPTITPPKRAKPARAATTR